MESTIVVKVKYAETLRRFIARVKDGKLEFTLDGLREKICGLFKFSLDSDVILTYLDEDDDEVTLGDDEDLYDVVIQDLNPLRISVRYSPQSSSGTPGNGGNSMPLIAPGMQQPFDNLNSTLSNFLNSVPEPLREEITRTCADLVSTGVSSGPSFAHVLQCFLEMGLPYVRQPSESSAASDSVPSGSVLAERETANVPTSQEAGRSKAYNSASKKVDASAVSKSASQEADRSKVNKFASEVLSNEKTEKLSKLKETFVQSKSPSTLETLATDKSHAGIKSQVNPTGETVKFVNASDGSKGSAGFPGLEAAKVALDSVDKMRAPQESLEYEGLGSPRGVADMGRSEAALKKKMADSDDYVINWRATKSPYSGGMNFADTSPLDKKENFQRPNFRKPVNVGAHPFPLTSGSMTWGIPNSQPNSVNSLWNVPGSGLGNSLASNGAPSPAVERLFSGVVLGENAAAAPPPFPHDFDSRRNHGNRDGMRTIFHRGVRCDGCGVYPITGLRYKSKVKDDYDLCSICFAQMGTEGDYIRIDRPLAYRHPLPLRGLYDLPSRMHPPVQPHVFRGCGVKQSRPKLDSRFIQDVNILDGTLMAPSIQFTKIWRMRNNGSVIWPQGTQLVWIGGDKLSDVPSVELEITAGGLPLDRELDVAVDFTAPGHPGRYISYWRMSSPTGQKFGQRVWVLIQVDASRQGFEQEAIRGFNLNLPPVAAGGSGPETVDVNMEPVVEDGLCNDAVDLVGPVTDVPSQKDGELTFPINDSLLVGSGLTKATTPSSSVSYPIIDLSDIISAPSGDNVAFFPPSPNIPFVPPPATVASAPSSSNIEHPEPPVTTAFVPKPVIVASGTTEKPQTPVTVASTSAEEEVSNEVEKNLLNELNKMGFTQVDLNKEVLRSNEYDLEKSLNDLCGVSEWDPILEELHEMGFHDDEMNKKLLKKNNGSVTQVVLDLLVEEE